MKETLPGILTAAVFFGGYQLIARSAGKTDITGTFIMAFSSLVPLVFLLGFKGVSLPSAATSKSLMFAGLLMGIAFSFHISVITHPKVDVSTAVTCISVLVVFVVTIGGVLFFGEGFSARKVAGILLAIVAIALLRPGDKPEQKSGKNMISRPRVNAER